jgi:hypothetical protein
MPVSGTRLVDVNVWLALAFGVHVHYPVAVSWFAELGERDAAFCRITQMALLRQRHKIDFWLEGTTLWLPPSPVESWNTKRRSEVLL